MSDLQQQFDEALARLRRAGTDLQTVEVKAAQGGLPKTVCESVAAFANASGGLLILGLDEAAAFQPVHVDAAKLAADLASACADQLDPPIRADVDIVDLDGHPVVVASVDPLPVELRPCFVRARGIERGSFLRTHDGDRALTTYEVHVLRSSRGQPVDDSTPVPGASMADLDPALLANLIRRLRATRGPVFANAADDEILRMLGVTVSHSRGEDAVSLAGLLALGRYPQQFFPQLDVTFVAFATTNGEPLADGTRFLDNQSIDGPIPLMVAETLTAMRRNMKRRAVIVGLGRQDQWEYPEEAVRELVANALMHRDYHALARGTQVRVELYPDRLEVTSPGGLYGPIAQEDLFAEAVSSSRNARLAKLLEDVELGATGRTVCENRGTGLLALAAALRHAGIEPPRIADNVREFRVVLHNHGLLDADALDYLSRIDATALNDRQRLALAFLHRHGAMNNQQYRSLTGSDSLTATRELGGLAAAGFIDKARDRRWAVWSPAVMRLDRRGSPPRAVASARHGAARRDRRAEIRALLVAGPVPASELAERLQLTRATVLRWLRRMEAEGVVEPTGTASTDPRTMWRLLPER